MEGEKGYCTLYIVRHGETEWNKAHIIQGHKDSPLTPEGTRQVHATAQILKDVHFDAIFSSDSSRAKETAKIIRLNRELAIKTSQLLRERKFGPFEGKPSAEFHEAAERLLEEKERLTEQKQWEFSFGKDMESDKELANRFIVQLREIAASYPDKTVLVVTHGGCIRMFLTKTGYVKYGELQGGAFQNAGYIKVLSDGLDFFIKEVRGVKDPIT